MFLQKDHDVFHFALRYPAGTDFFCPLPANAGNLCQAFRTLFDDFERVLAETVHNLL